MKLKENALDHHPFFLLFQLGVRIQHLNQRLEERVGISLTQWALLKRLVDLPAISALALADALGVQPSTLTQALKRLETRDYLFVGKDPADSRRKLISITRSGMTALQQADQEMSAWLEEADLSPDQVRSMIRVLGELSTPAELQN